MNVVIIGAGPAGLFAAIEAASNPDNNVIVLEKNDQPGKKLLIAGSGRCNLTNDRAIGSFPARYGGKERFVKPALFDFNNEDLKKFFLDRGLRLTTMANGKVFPQSERSRDVLDVLLKCLDRPNVRIHFLSAVRSVEYQTYDQTEMTETTGITEETETKEASGIAETSGVSGTGSQFVVHTDSQVYTCDRLVLSTGGKSYPSTGSTGDGYALAESLGHEIVPPIPALTPLIIESPFVLSECAGISLPDVSMSLRRTGRKIADFEGDLLITHEGFSGPGILDNSRFIAPGDTLIINWVGPEMALELDRTIVQILQQSGRKTIRNALRQLGLPDRLLEVILKISGVNTADREQIGHPETIVRHVIFPARQYGEDVGLYGESAAMTRQDRKVLVRNLRESSWTVDRLGDFRTAMVTAGGVAVEQVRRNTMESRLVPGLYFCGEVMDVDADTGGFNLQWAFSSGRKAGQLIPAEK